MPAESWRVCKRWWAPRHCTLLIELILQQQLAHVLVFLVPLQEQATLSEAEQLLKRLGYRGSLTQGGDSNTVKRLDQTSLTVHAR